MTTAPALPALDWDALIAKAQAEYDAWRNPTKPAVYLDYATSGLNVGAELIARAAIDEAAKLGLDVLFLETAGDGTDFLDPWLDVKLPGRPRIRYANLDEELARELVRRVIKEGDLWKERATAVLQEEPYEGIPSLWSHPYFAPQYRLLTRRYSLIDPTNVYHYLATGGFAALRKAITSMTPDEVLGEMRKSKLAGRGGALFPTWRKWEGAKNAKGYPKYIICNADEGVPGAWVDRTILEADPCAVIEGMMLAGYTIGSDEGYFYIRSEYPLAESRFVAAVRHCEELGLLGQHIFGSEFSFTMHARRGAGSYLAGESSALMSSLEGYKAQPRLKRPRSVEKGLWAKPTCMNNVETFANCPHIVGQGGDWYASIGTRDSAGTKLFSVAGAINRTGVVEVPFGVTMNQVIEACGGPKPGSTLKMAQLDGQAGGILPASLFDMPMDISSYNKVLAPVGSGGVLIMDESTCCNDLLWFCLDFNEDESCDRCTTCRVATTKSKRLFERVALGRGGAGDLATMFDMAEAMKRNSHCGLGQAAPNPLYSILKFFREEMEEHIFQKRCRAKVCRGLIQYRLSEAAAKSLDPGLLQRLWTGERGPNGEYVLDQDAVLRYEASIALLESGAIEIVDRPVVERLDLLDTSRDRRQDEWPGPGPEQQLQSGLIGIRMMGRRFGTQNQTTFLDPATGRPVLPGKGQPVRELDPSRRN